LDYNDEDLMKASLMKLMKDKGYCDHGKAVVRLDKWAKVGWTKNGVFYPMCLLCETFQNLTTKGVWVEERKNGFWVVLYYLCNDCFKDLKNQPEKQRQSMEKKVIERKIRLIFKIGTTIPLDKRPKSN
jgi:hypothetical protein